MAKLSVGGQAVIEGVMMRGPKDVATAVRDPNGRIQVETHPVSSIADRYPILKKPMLRGTVSLVESLVLGLRSLSYSAKMAGDEDEQLTDKEMAGTIIFALVLASILFIAIPTGAAKFFHFITDDPVFLNLMEGFLRLAIFLAYIGGISRMKDIRRVFQYHGAEHKTIHCYEAGLPLTVANVQRFSRLHPRCGTTFLLFVMSIAILLHTVLVPLLLLVWTPDSAVAKHLFTIAFKLLLMVPISALSYELIRYAARLGDGFWGRILRAPGMFLQLLTTREPELDQVEVAVAALASAVGQHPPRLETPPTCNRSH